MKNNLKIAVVSAADPYDRRTWSGSSFSMVRALEKHCGKVDYLGTLNIPGQKLRQRLAKLNFKISGKRSYPGRTRRASEIFAEQISGRLATAKYDLIFAPAASVEISSLQTDLPIVYVSDTTFSLVRDIYPIFSSLSNESMEDEEFFERSALNKAKLILYASAWAAQSAIEDYGVDKDKVKVIPFGANLDHVPPKESVRGKTINGTVNILFLSKEWERKGGPIALETLKILLNSGINSKLTVCGVVPPSGFEHPCMEVIPYLNKNIPEQKNRLQEILNDSHLLLLPTRAECYGVVFCEANAYGLPVFSTEVGGIPSIIKNGENGYLLPLKAGGKDFARIISRTVQNPESYSTLNRGARKRYDKILNWDVWGQNVRQAIKEKTGI